MSEEPTRVEGSSPARAGGGGAPIDSPHPLPQGVVGISSRCIGDSQTLQINVCATRHCNQGDHTLIR